MKNNNELLNEKQYRETNKKVKKVGTLLIIIGVAMIVGGVASDIIGEATNNMALRKVGMASIIGFAVTVWGVMLRFMIGENRKITGFLLQQSMPVAKEASEKMAPTAGKVATEVTKGVKRGLEENRKKSAQRIRKGRF